MLLAGMPPFMAPTDEGVKLKIKWARVSEHRKHDACCLMCVRARGRVALSVILLEADKSAIFRVFGVFGTSVDAGGGGEGW